MDYRADQLHGGICSVCAIHELLSYQQLLLFELLKGARARKWSRHFFVNKALKTQMFELQILQTMTFHNPLQSTENSTFPIHDSLYNPIN